MLISMDEFQNQNKCSGEKKKQEAENIHTNYSIYMKSKFITV